MGEHSVLRGHDAIVLPLPDFHLTFSVWEKTSCREPRLEDAWLYEVIKFALSKYNKSTIIDDLSFSIDNTIPLAKGLGSSAALCVALARWLQWKNLLSSDQEVFQFAVELESYFHGKSSGLDVAGVMCSSPVIYRMPGQYTPLTINWQPYLYLSYTGVTSLTFECVKKVENLFHTNPTLAQDLDLRMHEATHQSIEALSASTAEQGLPLLTNAFTQGKACHEAWGLITPQTQEYMNRLYQKGARTCKPTGSGAGGYVLSLWEIPPPPSLSSELLLVRLGIEQ